MATIYVSYRSLEESFVRELVANLEPLHKIRIDYNIPAGSDWRSHQLEELRSSEVFLVLVSKDTRASDFQNTEMGAARFCQRFIDEKLLIPALIDDVDPPRPLANLDCLDLRHRDPKTGAAQIEREIARRKPRVRLFVSHAHMDTDVAARLVDVIASNINVPKGELRCTSVAGYQLDLGAMAPDQLRRELGSAGCVLALLTPNSLRNDWVLFELGACWSNANVFIPLLAGGLQDRDIPGPLRGAAGGQLNDPRTLDRMLDQIQRELSWEAQPGLVPNSKRHEFVEYLKTKVFSQDSIEGELQAGFAAKRSKIGVRQGMLLDQLTAKLGKRAYLPIEEISQMISASGNEIHYRLEQLRLLGFLRRIELGEADGTPVFGWALSDKYRRDIGL